MNLITLTKGNNRLVIDPKGCYVRNWEVNGRQMMYSDPAKPKRASHPCGPIFHGLPLDSYQLGGNRYHLDRHGFLRTSNWETKQIDDDEVKMRLINTARHALPGIFENQYPFHFIFRMSFKLTDENTLVRALSFTNLTKDRAAPVDLALHDYYPFAPGVKLPELLGLYFWNETKGVTPCATRVRTGCFDREDNRDWHFPIGKNTYGLPDNAAFTGLNMTYPDGSNIKLEPLENVNRMVIWTDPEEGNFLCAEPVGKERGSLAKATAFQVEYNQTVTLKHSVSITA